MFRCPHCRERTIGLWAKLKANGWRPSACLSCGGKYVPAAWGQVPALAALFAGIAVPWVMTGPRTMSLAAAGWMLAGSIVFGLLVSVMFYLLITPLLRHDSRAARWDWWSYAGALAVVIIWAAAYSPREPAAQEPVVRRSTAGLPPGYELGSMTISEPDLELHAELKAALAKAGVPFTVEAMPDGREGLKLRQEQVEAYHRVEREIWGERPPANGRSVHMSDEAAMRDFRKWLSDAGIPNRIMTYQRKDFVVWEGEPYIWRKFRDQRPSGCAKPRAQLEASKRC